MPLSCSIIVTVIIVLIAGSTDFGDASIAIEALLSSRRCEHLSFLTLNSLAMLRLIAIFEVIIQFIQVIFLHFSFSLFVCTAIVPATPLD
jgi:hypothetical protein